MFSWIKYVSQLTCVVFSTVLCMNHTNIGSKSSILLCDRNSSCSSYVEKKWLLLQNSHLFCKVKTCTKKGSRIFGLYIDLPRKKNNGPSSIFIIASEHTGIFLAITNISQGDSLNFFLNWTSFIYMTRT